MILLYFLERGPFSLSRGRNIAWLAKHPLHQNAEIKSAPRPGLAPYQ
jgi:hypothetical protein